MLRGTVDLVHRAEGAAGERARERVGEEGCQLIVRQRHMERRQFQGLKVGELKQRARASGVSTSAIDAAIDQADDPKEAIIGLILAARPMQEGEPPEPEPEPEPPHNRSRGGSLSDMHSLRGTWSGPSGPPNESLAISSVSSPGFRSSIAYGDFGDVVRDATGEPTSGGGGGFAKLRGTLHNAGEMQRVRSHLTTLQGEHDELLLTHQETLEKLAAEAQLREELEAAAKDADESREALLREQAELQQGQRALATQHAEVIRETGHEHRVAMEQQRAATDQAAREHREADAAHRAAFAALQQQHDRLVANAATLESELAKLRASLDAEASRSAASASQVSELQQGRDRDSLTASRLQSELRQTKDELAAANAAISALKSESSAVTQARQDELGRLREQLASQQGSLEATQKELVALTGEKAQLELRATAHDQLVPKFEAVQAELRASVSQCGVLEHSLAAKSSACEDLDARMSHTEAEREALSAALAKEKQQVVEMLEHQNAMQASASEQAATHSRTETELAATTSALAASKSESAAVAQAHQQEIGRLSSHITSLQETLEVARQDVLALSSEKASLITEKAGLAAQITSLSPPHDMATKLETLRSDLQAAEASRNELERSLRAKSLQLEKLEGTHEHKLAIIADLQSQMASAGSDRASLESESGALLKERQAQVVRLEKQLAASQEALETARHEVLELSKEKSSLSVRATAHDEMLQKLEAAQAELTMSMAARSELEKSLLAKSASIETLEAEQEAKMATFVELESELAAASASIASLKSEGSAVSEARQEEIGRLSEQLASQQKALEAAQREVLTLSRENAGLEIHSQAYAELAAKFEVTQADLNASASACNVLEQSLAAKSESWTDLEAAHLAKIASIGELERKLAAANSSMAALKSESSALSQARQDEIARLSAQLSTHQSALESAQQEVVRLTSEKAGLAVHAAAHDELVPKFEAVQAELNRSVATCNQLDEALTTNSGVLTKLEASHESTVNSHAALEGKLSTLSAELAALSAGSDASKRALQQDVDRLNAEMAASEEALQAARQEIVALSSAKSGLAVKAEAHDQIAARLETVQAELTETSVSYRNSKEAAAAAQAKCESLQAELTDTMSARDVRAKDEIDRLTTQLASAQAALEKAQQLTLKLSTDKGHLEARTAAYDELVEKFEVTQADLNASASACNVLEQSLAAKSESWTDLEAAHLAKIASIGELERKLAAANSSMAALKSESSALSQARQDEIARLSAQLSTHQSALESAQQEVVRLTSEKAGLAVHAAAHDELVPKFEAVQAELNRSVSACNELETSLSTRTSSLSELKAEHEAKVAGNSELEIKLATASVAMATLKSESSALAQTRQEEIDHLSAQLDSEREELSKTRQEVLKLSSSMAGMSVRAAAHDDIARRFEAVQAELTETSLSYRNSEEALASTTAARSSLEAELAATKSARDALAQDQAHHKQMVTELDSKKDALLQEIAALAEKHAHTESKLSQKSQAHAKAEAVQRSNAASIGELESELAAANAAISALKSESSAVTQARQDELGRLREQLASQQGSLEATQKELVALTGEKAQLELRATAHDQLVPKFEAVQAELNRSVSACNELETSLSTRTSSLSELKAEHEAKVGSIADLHSQLATSASTISALRSQNSTAEQAHQDELKRLSARLAAEQQAREAARTEMLALSSEKASLVTEKAGLAARATEAHKVLSELKDGHTALSARHEKILVEKRAAHRDALAQKQNEVDEVKAELKMTLSSRTELLGALSTVQESLRESQARSEATANANRELQARHDAEKARTAALESELAAAKSEIASAAEGESAVASERQAEIDRLVGQLRSMQTSLDRRQEVVHLLSQQVEYLLTMVPNAGSADDSMAAQQRFSLGSGTGDESSAARGRSAVASPSQFGAGK